MEDALLCYVAESNAIVTYLNAYFGIILNLP